MLIRFPIARIEEVLQSWEDNAFCEAATVVATRKAKGWNVLDAADLRYRTFRTELLSARPEMRFDSERFGPIFGRLNGGKKWFYGRDAFHIFNWVAHSRRVYEVTEEMATLLMSTTLDGLLWSDVRWPFDAFAVTVPQPVQIGRDRYDCFMVACSSLSHGRVFIHGSGPNRSPWQRISEDDRRKARRWAEGRRLNELEQFLKKNDVHRDAHAPPTLYLTVETDKVAIEDTHAIIGRNGFQGTLRGEESAQTTPVFRLIAGLCLYLSSLTPRQNAVAIGVGQTVHTLDKTAVTDGAEVATVANCHILSSEEHASLDAPQRRPGEIPAHWRAGHWRRQPGKGTDPSAPHCVWVSPTMVRRDRLPDDGVPGGTKTIIRS